MYNEQQQKEIAEMAECIHGRRDKNGSLKTAQALYDAGYRKTGGLNLSKSTWHKIADGDFPGNDDEVICYIENRWGGAGYTLGSYCSAQINVPFSQATQFRWHLHCADGQVVAWMSFPQYEEDESKRWLDEIAKRTNRRK